MISFIQPLIKYSLVVCVFCPLFSPHQIFRFLTRLVFSVCTLSRCLSSRLFDGSEQAGGEFFAFFK